MHLHTRHVLAAAVLAATSFTLVQCSRSTSSSPGTEPAAVYAPVLSVQELMEHMVDPTADWIFDAAAVDVSAKGTVETKPVTDEDWLKVERGLWTLAESSNLLKMARPVSSSNSAPAPGELSHAEVEAKINQNRELWNKHADELKTAAVESMKVVKARNVDGLFQIGNDIDKACESCHLEFWYPGDREAVQADKNSRVTITPPKK